MVYSGYSDPYAGITDKVTSGLTGLPPDTTTYSNATGTPDVVNTAAPTVNQNASIDQQIADWTAALQYSSSEKDYLYIQSQIDSLKALKETQRLSDSINQAHPNWSETDKANLLVSLQQNGITSDTYVSNSALYDSMLMPDVKDAVNPDGTPIQDPNQWSDAQSAAWQSEQDATQRQWQEQQAALDRAAQTDLQRLQYEQQRAMAGVNNQYELQQAQQQYEYSRQLAEQNRQWQGQQNQYDRDAQTALQKLQYEQQRAMAGVNNQYELQQAQKQYEYAKQLAEQSRQWQGEQNQYDRDAQTALQNLQHVQQLALQGLANEHDVAMAKQQYEQARQLAQQSQDFWYEQQGAMIGRTEGAPTGWAGWGQEYSQVKEWDPVAKQVVNKWVKTPMSAEATLAQAQKANMSGNWYDTALQQRQQEGAYTGNQVGTPGFTATGGNYGPGYSTFVPETVGRLVGAKQGYDTNYDLQTGQNAMGVTPSGWYTDWQKGYTNGQANPGGGYETYVASMQDWNRMAPSQQSEVGGWLNTGFSGYKTPEDYYSEIQKRAAPSGGGMRLNYR